MKIQKIISIWFYIVSIAVVTRAERYSVMFPNIPRPVTMTFPTGFAPPSSTEDRERRERFLEFYRQNPAMKGKYCEVLLQNWVGQCRLPQIVVGVLGSTEKQQGKITQSEWNGIREIFLQASAFEVQKIRENIRPLIEENSPIANRTREELVWFENQKDEKSVVILTQMRTQIGDAKDDVFSARKLIYHKGYLVFANVVVDSSRPDALSEIRAYLTKISIEAI